MKYWRMNIGVYAVVWSLIIGMLTAAYLNLVNWVIHLVWKIGPAVLGISSKWYPFVACIPLGFLIGYLNKRLGDYPLIIEEVLVDVRMKGKINYQQWWKSFVLGLLVLGAGGSVGPEASTTVLTSSMVNWLGDRIRWFHFRQQAGKRGNIWWEKMTKQELAEAPQFGKLFKDRTQKKMLLFFLIVVGVIGATIIFILFPEEGVFGIHHQVIQWQWVNLLTAIPTFLVGMGFGWFFVRLGNWTSLLNTHFGKVWQGGIFGLILAASSLLTGLVLFSGEFQIVPFSEEALKMSIPFLLMVAFGKSIITNLGFSMGWRGGTIFPAIFASLALGSACALLLPGDLRVNAIIVLSASLTIILERPVLTIIIILLLVPIELAPVVIPACFAVNFILKHVQTKKQE